MPTDCISYQNSGFFTPIINDYLNQDPELKPLYNRFPTLENFEEQILEKQRSYNFKHRQVLVSVLQEQCSHIQMSELTRQNISALATANTFTVTTGHQLNLFTGPLYFLYKIISTVNLTKELKAKYPQFNFVPVYWMATEDHDFEEINYFNFKGKKFRWNKEVKGAVGRLSTGGLEEVLEVFGLELGTSISANALKKLFHEAYIQHINLADATRFLANALFSEYGLIIIDADDAVLKREFVPHIKTELLSQTSHKLVLETIQKLKKYGIQVNPREINLFYLENNLRERIVFEQGMFKVNNTKIHFSETEILRELDNYPEKFSPNVIMRPLYQEVILPNLCYIGGGGELSYWLELKAYFDSEKVTFPILLLRNSVLLATEKQARKADKLNLSWKDLFLKQDDLLALKVKGFSEFPIDLEIQKEHLRNQFHYLHLIAERTDKSFSGAVKAQEVKQINGLDHLEKRLLKAEKRKHAEKLQRVTDLQNDLFPNHGLQERKVNFSEFYRDFGVPLIERLVNELKPLNNQIAVLVL